jgi:hypothetical protein
VAEEPEELKPMTPEQIALLMKNPEILKGLQKLFGRLGPPPGIVEDLNMATEEERNRFTEWYRERGPRADWCYVDEAPADGRRSYWRDGLIYFDFDFSSEPVESDYARSKRLTSQLLHGYPPKPKLPGFACDCGDPECTGGVVVVD